MGLIDQITGVESGGNPNATNPRSTATGLGQFIESTWLDTISRHRPDLVQGRSPAEILALRRDPEISREMTAAYAADNGKVLTRAGHEVTPGSTYLAHFAGPEGAVSVLSADPSTPVSRILKASAIEANPFLQGMTAGDLRAWADRKMGQRGVAAQPAPASPSSPANGLLSAPVSSGLLGGAAPIFPQQSAQPQQQAQGMGGLMMQPEQITPTQINFARPRMPDLSKLRAAFGKAPIFPRV